MGMGYSSPRDHQHCEQDMGHAVAATESSSSAAAQLRRQYSGRMTENSDNWLRVGGEDSRPAAPVIANSTDHVQSKGKKINIAKDADNMKRRLRLDSSQSED